MIIITLSLSSFIKEMINSITSSDYYNFKNTSNLTNVFAKLIINESRFLFKLCRILVKTMTVFKTSYVINNILFYNYFKVLQINKLE